MKLFTALAALTLIAAPVQAQHQFSSHSFPGVGPTGTVCTTSLIGSYGSTRCSRGLTSAEKEADKAQWSETTSVAASQQNLPANYCETQVAKADAIFAETHHRIWADTPRVQAMGPSLKASLLSCQGAVQDGKGESWRPFAIGDEYETALDAAGF